MTNKHTNPMRPNIKGKHVFCEKPLVITTADSERILAASEQSGKVLEVGFVLRVAMEQSIEQDHPISLSQVIDAKWR